MTEQAYRIDGAAEHARLGLGPGTVGVFDPAAGEPEAGDVVALWARRARPPGRPLVLRISGPRKHAEVSGRPSRPGLFFDTHESLAHRFYFDFFIGRMDKLVRIEARPCDQPKMSDT